VGWNATKQATSFQMMTERRRRNHFPSTTSLLESAASLAGRPGCRNTDGPRTCRAIAINCAADASETANQSANTCGRQLL